MRLLMMGKRNDNNIEFCILAETTDVNKTALLALGAGVRSTT